MRTSSNRPAGLAGFTLVEVLVVVLLIGLSLGVLLKIDFGDGPQQLANESRRFAGLAELVLEEAVLSGQDWGIDFFSEPGRAGDSFGYRWLQRGDDGWQEAVPAGMTDLPGAVLLPEGMTLALEIDGLVAAIGRRTALADPALVSSAFAPQVWLSPDHESTAFTLAFSSPGAGRLQVASDILGRIRVSPP